MPINPDLPNKVENVERFSETIDNILDSITNAPGSVQDILRLSSKAFAEKQASGRPILDELIKNVDRPILMNMAKDVVTIMSNWFEDPQLLCCLVQGLWGLYAVTRSQTLSNTDFGKWLDVLITFVDVIIVMLTSNIKKLTFMIPDFIKEIMTGVIGAILLVLQELLFAIRDSIINQLLAAIDSDAKTDQIWAKCLPLAQLIAILKKYINDFGLFAELFEKIKGFIGNVVGDFGYMKAFDFPNNVKDLEFLYWFRDLLLKLKAATISFDLCYLPTTAPTGSPIDLSIYQAPPGSPLATPSFNKTGQGDPSAVQGIVVASDGTILQDTNGLAKNSIPILTNSSIRGFLNKYYGYPLEVVDNLLTGSSSKDAIHGSQITSDRLSNLNADCPNSPTPGEIVAWALRVRNRNI